MNTRPHTEDDLPRDLIALIILHGLLSAGDPDSTFHDDLIASFADLAYAFADAMIKRGEA
jgi:hypothetical protein